MVVVLTDSWNLLLSEVVDMGKIYKTRLKCLKMSKQVLVNNTWLFVYSSFLLEFEGWLIGDQRIFDLIFFLAKFGLSYIYFRWN